MKKTKGYALFDLDQTLVPWDMQLLFANWVFHKYPSRRFYMILFLFALPLAPVLGLRRLKRVFLAFLHRLSPSELEELGESFVEHYFPTLFYPILWQRLQKHQDHGDIVILTSASPCIYVKKIGEKLGVTKTFCTKVKRESSMPLFPKIAQNNKGKHKITAIEKWLQKEEKSPHFPLPHSIAYTDSAADLPLIEIAEQAVLVNPSATLIEAVQKPKEILTPLRPFKTKIEKTLNIASMILGLYPIGKITHS